MAPTDRGFLTGGVPFAGSGIDLTRDVKALKVWLSLKAYGVHHHAAQNEQNVNDAQCFAAAIDAHADFGLLAPVPLNIACFRYAPAGAGCCRALLDAPARKVRAPSLRIGKLLS